LAGGWWLVAGGWWLVAGGWWLVAGGWWLRVCGRLLQSQQHPQHRFVANYMPSFHAITSLGTSGLILETRSALTH
jgi:hypothetical protein